MDVTRRQFVGGLAALAATPSLVSEREPLRAFKYGDVQLTGGPLGEQYDAMRAHYLSLSNDRLLKVYRQRAGLAAPGEEMGGWYDREGFVPGHALGQYISGLARFGASTGDAACHEKVHALVNGFAATLGTENQSILRPETNLWVCYTLDKHFAGLIDASTLSGMADAKELMNRVLEGARGLLPAKGRDRIGKKEPPYDETFVMPENLFTAAELTGNPAFRELAERYLLDKELFDPLARGGDPFPGQHAYSHAIALSSAAKAWMVLGDAKYKAAMERAFVLLTTTQQFSSGGWGPNETFITPGRGELYAALSSTVDHFETPCGAYAATKLARGLMRVTPQPADTRHGDNLERVLFNTILAVKRPDRDGDYPYYSTYSPAAKKVFYQKKWPCCSGTLAQTVADYPLNVYFEANDGLYVNLLTPSRVRFAHGEVVQETRYPVEDTSLLTFRMDRPAAFAVYVRIPEWASGASVNGKAVAAGRWARVSRTWETGDRVEVVLPQSFRTEAVDEQHPECVALMRGAVQYVALSGEKLKVPSGLKGVGAQRFLSEGVEFVPLYTVREEVYGTYFSKA
jgi:DUF1680 family protein